MAELPPHTTCVETTTYDEAAADGGRSWMCGPDCPRPAGPDAQRDERRAAYREREQRRAARALDRFVESLYLSSVDVPQNLGIGAARVAGERFVEAVGDYVLSRLHHRSHYGAAEQCTCRGASDPHPMYGYGCVGGGSAPQHNADSGASDE